MIVLKMANAKMKINSDALKSQAETSNAVPLTTNIIVLTTINVLAINAEEGGQGWVETKTGALRAGGGRPQVQPATMATIAVEN